MTNELIDFIDKRQEQVFRKMTDNFGRFKSSAGKSFWEGYLECLQDVCNFVEDQERDIEN